MSQDPIGERGGLNLYGMVNNDPVGKGDQLGLHVYYIAAGASDYHVFNAIAHDQNYKKSYGGFSAKSQGKRTNNNRKWGPVDRGNATIKDNLTPASIASESGKITIFSHGSTTGKINGANGTQFSAEDIKAALGNKKLAITSVGLLACHSGSNGFANSLSKALPMTMIAGHMGKLTISMRWHYNFLSNSRSKSQIIRKMKNAYSQLKSNGYSYLDFQDRVKEIFENNKCELEYLYWDFYFKEGATKFGVWRDGKQITTMNF